MFRSEKNSNWEGAYRVPAFVRWPGKLPAGKTLNGIVSHEDWLPTLAAAAGDRGIKDKLLTGVGLNGRSYKNYIDGYNQLDYLSGKAKASPSKEFMYVNDDGQIVALRYDGWKAVFPENRGQAFGVWREPFTELRVPLLFNLRRDPFERAQHNANTYNDWFLDRSVRTGTDAGFGRAVLGDDEGLSAARMRVEDGCQRQFCRVSARAVGLARPRHNAPYVWQDWRILRRADVRNGDG